MQLSTSVLDHTVDENDIPDFSRKTDFILLCPTSLVHDCT